MMYTKEEEWHGRCYRRSVNDNNDTKTSIGQVKGGFGSQVNSTGRPTIITPIKHIPVSFEEFMKDEATQEITINQQKGSV